MRRSQKRSEKTSLSVGSQLCARGGLARGRWGWAPGHICATPGTLQALERVTAVTLSGAALSKPLPHPRPRPACPPWKNTLEVTIRKGNHQALPCIT